MEGYKSTKYASDSKRLGLELKPINRYIGCSPGRKPMFELSDLLHLHNCIIWLSVPYGLWAFNNIDLLTVNIKANYRFRTLLLC